MLLQRPQPSLATLGFASHCHVSWALPAFLTQPRPLSQPWLGPSPGELSQRPKCLGKLPRCFRQCLPSPMVRSVQQQDLADAEAMGWRQWAAEERK